MAKIQVFDPAMCCSTGVCGPTVDTALVHFAADVEWLAREGVEVERFNLSLHPRAYMASATVRSTLQSEGTECLPLVLVDGEVVSRGAYPSRRQLAAWAGLEPAETPS
jgi:hypothetical protein